MVLPNAVVRTPRRGLAFLKDKVEQKCTESAESCGRMGVEFSPMVFDTWGGGSTEPGRRW